MNKRFEEFRYCHGNAVPKITGYHSCSSKDSTRRTQKWLCVGYCLVESVSGGEVLCVVIQV